MAPRVIEADVGEEERWIESESADDERDGEDGWADDEPIAPRPRGRLLRPLPLALIALTIAAAGFLGGVLAQKGSEGSSGAAGLGGGDLPAFAAAKAGGGTEGGGEAATAGGAEGGAAQAASGAAGVRSFGGSSAAATGTVTSVEGRTIYVKESDGTVVAVKAGDGSTVTRNSDVSAKKVHPGDTVVVEGSKHGSTVKASSIAATESGVESTSGFGAPGAAAAGGGSGPEGTSVESLFGE
jgi:hypothetical protein